MARLLGSIALALVIYGCAKPCPKPPPCPTCPTCEVCPPVNPRRGG